MFLMLANALGQGIKGNALTLGQEMNYYRPVSTDTYKRPDANSYYIRP